jgi:DDE_Tnp_1-associated/Transposase DDE domain
MDAHTAGSLLSFLAAVPDLRSRHGRRHPLTAILGLVCCAIMCGAKSYAAIAQWGHDQDIALMHRLGFTRKPPKLGGIRKVLIALDPKAFEDALTRWAESLLGGATWAEPAPPEAFALDGKTARGSFDGLEKAVHLLSLVAHRSGLTLAQTPVAQGGVDKTNEHKTALRLLADIALEGRLITGDAIFCQRDLSQQILDDGGHYLWLVKENQPTLLNDIQSAFAASAEAAFSPSTAPDLGRGAGHGHDPRQGTWSSRAPDVDGDDRAERVPGLARGGSGGPDRECGRAGRGGLPGDPLLHHQRPAAAGRCRSVAHVGPGALVDRESVALRARRDAR